MNLDACIFVAGHRGMVGSAIVRRLKRMGYGNIVTASHSELDLTRQLEVEAFFQEKRPQYVFLAAAKVGGIWANYKAPAEFIRDNLMIQTNVLHAAWQHQVKKVLFLGSSCIYPRECDQPIKESYLMTGPLEPTNSAYAVAKIAGIEMCWAYNRQYGTRFVPVMPTNLYGPNDNFDLTTSHVLPALIRKFHLANLVSQQKWDEIRKDDAIFGTIDPEFLHRLTGVSHVTDLDGILQVNDVPTVTLWGTGSALREFLHVDDLADACVFIMNNYQGDKLINIGTGKDISIKQLALLIADVLNFQGKLFFDESKPDGTPRKLLDVSRLKRLGWRAKIGLEQGIRMTYDWYLNALEKSNVSV